MPAKVTKNKKSLPDGSTCQGASFLPTATRSRSSHGNLAVEQANVVATHVASLQKCKGMSACGCFSSVLIQQLKFGIFAY